jgi:hypothetical protein
MRAVYPFVAMLCLILPAAALARDAGERAQQSRDNAWTRYQSLGLQQGTEQPPPVPEQPKMRLWRKPTETKEEPSGVKTMIAPR